MALGERPEVLQDRAAALGTGFESEAGPELAAIVDRVTYEAIRTHRQWSSARRRLAKAAPGGVSRLKWVVRNHDGPGQVFALIELASGARTADPQRSLEWAELAVQAAEQMEGRAGLSLQARAWAEKGNAERIQERYGDSRRSLERAVALLHTADGGEPGFRGEVFSLLASLEHALHRSDAALTALAEAIRCARLGGLPRLRWKLLVQEATVLSHVGRFQAALDCLHRAGLPRRVNDERVLLVAHNALWVLLEAALCTRTGPDRQALLGLVRHSLPSLEALYERHPGWSGRRTWLEGRLAFAEGDLDFAAFKLGFAVDELILGGELTTAAQAVLDLCLVHARVGEFADVRREALSACRVFEAAGLQQSRWAAVRLLVYCDGTLAETIILLGLKDAGGASLVRGAPGGF